MRVILLQDPGTFGLPKILTVALLKLVLDIAVPENYGAVLAILELQIFGNSHIR